MRANAQADSFGVVLKNGKNLMRFELLPAVQKSKLDHESALDHRGAQLGDQLGRRRRRAAGRDQVIGYDNARIDGQRIDVDLERIGAVLESIAGAVSIVWQFA